jgi:hypothetical protein
VLHSRAFLPDAGSASGIGGKYFVVEGPMSLKFDATDENHDCGIMSIFEFSYTKK